MFDNLTDVELHALRDKICRAMVWTRRTAETLVDFDYVVTLYEVAIDIEKEMNMRLWIATTNTVRW